MTGTYLHDIGNLVLTQNNSNYRNFDFARKKGQPGISPSYSNSDIRQERKISSFNDWRSEDIEKRRQELAAWILDRWAVLPSVVHAISDISDEDDFDDNGLSTQNSSAIEDIPGNIEQNGTPGGVNVLRNDPPKRNVTSGGISGMPEDMKTDSSGPRDPSFHREKLKKWLDDVIAHDPSTGANINKFVGELLKVFSDNPPFSWRFKSTKYNYPVFLLHDRATGKDNDFLVVANSKLIVLHKFFDERFRSLFPVENDYYGTGDGTDWDVYRFGEEKLLEYLEAIKVMTTARPEWYIRTATPYK
jgi:hypothetical protein